MRLITVSSYPNQEIRVVHSYEGNSRRKSHESRPETVHSEPSELPPLSFAQNSKLPKSVPVQEASESAKPPGYGSLGRQYAFSSYGRRQMLRAGGALEKVVRHQDCLFLTLTHPGSTDVSFKALAAWSSFSVQRLKAWLGKRIKNNYSMYSWEWQKRGALHLHYVVYCPDRKVAEYIKTHLREQWCRILDSISEKSGVDLYKQSSLHTWSTNKSIVRVDVQYCRKSVAAYISKYVSKTSLEKRFSKRGYYAPVRWYGVSRPLLSQLKSLTQVFRVSSLSRSRGEALYEDLLSSLQSWCSKGYEWKHKYGVGSTAVYYFQPQEDKAIWREIVSQLPTYEHSNLTPCQDVLRLTRRGLFLMQRSDIFRQSFMRISNNYLNDLVTRVLSSEPITILELVLVADTVLYALVFVRKSLGVLSSNLAAWERALGLCLKKERAKPEFYDREYLERKVM